MAVTRGRGGRMVQTTNLSAEDLAAEYQNAIDKISELNKLKAQGVAIDENRKNLYIESLNVFKEEKRQRKKVNDLIKDANNLAEAHIDATKEVLDISENIIKSSLRINKVSNKTGDLFANLGGLAGEVAVKLEKQAFSSTASVNAAKDSVSAMNDYSDSIAKAMEQFKAGELSSEGLADSIKYAEKELNKFVENLDDANPEIAEIKKGLEGAIAPAKALTKAFAEGKVALSEMKEGLTEVITTAGSGIPVVGSLVSTFSGLGKMGMVAGIFALGIALGELAEYLADVFGWAGLWTGQTETQKEATLALHKSIIDLNADLVMQSYALGQGIQLSGGMIEQMAKLGVSGDALVSATMDASNNLGLAGVNAQKTGADLALMSARTGTSADSLGQIAKTFRLVGNLSGKAAVETLGVAENVAKTAGIPVQTMFEDLANASELLLQNNYGNEASLMKQVATLRVMGFETNKILQAGQGMVLNYKDSIKSEMELSALLGRQVDLSQVRQKFAAGDNVGAMESLRQSLRGIDIDKMNMFQRQALQQATGMDMATLMQAAKGGKGGKLQTEQEKNAQSAAELNRRLTNAISDKGVSIYDANAEAANTKFATDIAAEQEKKLADFHHTVENSLDKVLYYLGGILVALLGGALFKGGLGKIGEAITGKLGKVSGFLKSGPGSLGKVGEFFKGGVGKTLGLGGAALIGGVQAYQNFNTLREGETEVRKTDKLGAGVVQGGLSALGTGLGMAFGGPIGAMIGGFLGDSLGGWINKNAPGLAQKIGDIFEGAIKLWDKMKEAWDSLVNMISNGFAKMWNKIADTGFGKFFGMSKKEIEPVVEKSKVAEPQKDAAKAEPTKKEVVVKATDASNVGDYKYTEGDASKLGYSTQLQKEMVEILRVSTGLLTAIMENTSADTDIRMDGKKLTAQLYKRAENVYTAKSNRR